MKFYVFALVFFFVTIFAVNAHVIDREHHDLEYGKQCMSNADCPRGQICLFPIPWHGEPGECT